MTKQHQLSLGNDLRAIDTNGFAPSYSIEPMENLGFPSYFSLGGAEDTL